MLSRPAAAVRLGDQRVDFPLRLGAGHQQHLKPAVVDHAGEAIARDEEQVADAAPRPRRCPARTSGLAPTQRVMTLL